MRHNYSDTGVMTRLAVGLLLALASMGVAAPEAWSAAGEILHLRCTNPAGGANWSISVDLEHRLVDSLPATISDTWISWHNPNGGTYELERATGNLQLRAASTTGGFFLHYTCQQE
jgi:hypothetical protein